MANFQSGKSGAASRIRDKRDATHFHDLPDYYWKRGRNGHSLWEVIRERDRKGIGVETWVFSWPTLVLGSGALPDPVGDDEDLVSITTITAEGLKGLDVDSAAGIVELTDEFVGELTALRLGRPIADGMIPRAVVTTELGTLTLAVEVAVIAALATRLYAEALTRTRVLQNADHELLEIPRTPALHGLIEEIAAPLVALVKQVRKRLNRRTGRTPASGAESALAKLLSIVETDLGTGDSLTIDRSHVELLTALTWFFLTDGTANYPGWADVLLFQAASVVDEESLLLAHPSLRRPNLSEIASANDTKWIQERFGLVTRKSWERTAPGSDRLHAAAADLLLQQAEIGERLVPDRGDTHLPLATAFITSFDVELEIALWRRMAAADSDACFILVIPIFATAKEPYRRGALTTSFTWVYRLVQPSGKRFDDFERAVLASEEPWYSLSSMDAREAFGKPIVVHLSGAPLLKLETVSDREFPADRFNFSHAVLLDEHRALVEVASDFEQASQRRFGLGNLSSDATYPEEMIAPRFWMFIGTQLDDTGVRLRLLAQEIAALHFGSNEGLPTHEGRTISRGVMVNRWVPIAERSAFTWQNIDVVQGEVSDLVDELVTIHHQTARIPQPPSEWSEDLR